MTQIKRIIQLKSEGLSKLKISQKLSIHRKTLDDYLFKIEITFFLGSIIPTNNIKSFFILYFFKQLYELTEKGEGHK